MNVDQQIAIATDALEELKGLNTVVLDVRDKCSVTDYLIIVTGTSNRHVKALANEVITESKKAGAEVLGTEGAEVAEWVLVDLGDVVVHVMLPKTRDFYQLEKFWSADFSEERA